MFCALTIIFVGVVAEIVVLAEHVDFGRLILQAARAFSSEACPRTRSVGGDRFASRKRVKPKI
jgi:hypothetical protein